MLQTGKLRREVLGDLFHIRPETGQTWQQTRFLSPSSGLHPFLWLLIVPPKLSSPQPCGDRISDLMRKDQKHPTPNPREPLRQGFVRTGPVGVLSEPGRDLTPKTIL